MNKIFWTLILGLCLTTPLDAGNVVDSSAGLETIATDFELCDGPAWDGSGTLYFPDVKAQKLYRYAPKTKVMNLVLQNAGRLSASFYSHGKLFLSDNGESRIVRLDGRQKVLLAGHDKDAKPPIRPNDLVVDQQGGVYYTLTRQGQVMYITPTGKQIVAVKKIDSPNGLILSPDGSTLYVASYVPKKILAYKIAADGTATGGPLFAEMDSGPDKGANVLGIGQSTAYEHWAYAKSRLRVLMDGLFSS